MRTAALCVAVIFTIAAALISAPPALADIAKVKAAAKTVPANWMSVRPARHKLVDVDFFEAIGGDTSNIRPRNLTSYRGKIIILNFWASWCGPCRVEKPRLQVLKRRLDPNRFAVVTINAGGRKDTRERVTRFYKEHSITDLGLMRIRDINQIKGKPLRLQGLPASYIIDPDGKLIADVDTIAWDDPKMAAFLKKLEQVYF